MISELMIRRVCLVRCKVDFRKGHDGLLAEAYKLDLSPYEGDVVVFIGRRKNSAKILFADPTGLWVSHKKFQKGMISRDFNFINDKTATVIAPSTVTKLLEGSQFLLRGN